MRVPGRVLAVSVTKSSQAASRNLRAAENDSMNALAERYVKLVLALGQHDADYVDAYYGPPSGGRRRKVGQRGRSSRSTRDAAAVQSALVRGQAGCAVRRRLSRLRHEYLTRQLGALRARVSMLAGQEDSRFDEESRALYDAVAPTHTESEFDAVLKELESRLPGTGHAQRTAGQAFRVAVRRFPKDRLDATFKAAIEGCRSRTLAHLQLPPGESFTVEYVTNKSWAGYNWYQGNYHSIIQVNTDLADLRRSGDRSRRATRDIPGITSTTCCSRRRSCATAAGSSSRCIRCDRRSRSSRRARPTTASTSRFPRPERLQFERTVIFPTAGLDPAGVETLLRGAELSSDRLSYAGNEAARRYLNGQFDAAAAAQWLERYGLYSPPRAQQRVRFIDQYRSYVINYNLGKDMVARYVEAESGGGTDAARRWDASRGCSRRRDCRLD